MKIRTRQNQGFTIVEMLFAMIIISMILSGSYLSLSQGSFMTRISMDHYRATTLAQNRLERIRNLPVDDAFLMEESNVLVDSDGNADPDGFFRRTTAVTDTARDNVKQVTVTVEIKDMVKGMFDGREQEVTTLITDYPQEVDAMKMRGKQGFSLMELLFATFLSVMVISTAIRGWTFLMYGYNKNSIQQELDIDVRMAMENFKQDLRLTSLDKVVFYPAGPGPYTALSFPKAHDDDGDGLIDVDGDGNVIWDETVIYHIYQGSPNQLRRTSFMPRDNAMSDPARYQQLESTVNSGIGTGNATTRPLFSNLFEWEIEGKGAIFDGYTPAIGRKEFIDLGSAMVDPGTHSITLRSLGKNPQSAGYKLGLDTLTVTSSRSTLQGEMRAVLAVDGGPYSTEYIEGGSWSDNNHLEFDAGGAGDLITFGFDNDCWEETVFTGTGAETDGAIVEFDQGYYPSTYVVKLPGSGVNWTPSDQTGDEAPTLSPTAGNVAGQAIRVLVKGGNLGGPIIHDGGRPWYLIRAASGGNLMIQGISLAESASDLTGPSPDTVPGTEVNLRFGGSSGASSQNLAADSFAWVTPEAGVDLDIDMDKTYALTFLVNEAATHGNAPYYTNPNPAAVESYVIPDTENPGLTDISDNDWASKNPLPDHRVFAVQNSWVQVLSAGSYTSPIFDTHQPSPQYTGIDWDMSADTGMSIGIKVRTSDHPDMSGALDWSSVTAMSGPGGLGVASKRYIQFQAILDAGPNAWTTPRLKNVVISWDGVSQINDIALSYTTGPDMGIYEVEVDGNPLLKGLKARIEIYQDAPVFGGNSRRITSEVTEEIEPRNSAL